MLGGRTTLDVTSNDVQTAAACAIAAQNAQSNSVYAMQLVRIVSATKQVVAGVRYDMVLEAGVSSCMNDGAAHTLAACPVNGATTQYNAAVVVQSWNTPSCSLVSFAPINIDTNTNTDTDATTAMPGGQNTADIASEDVQNAAACAVAAQNARSNSMYALQITRIISATKQVVAGVRYDMVLEAGMSSCRNDGSQHTLAACPVNGATTQYNAAVVVQPWATPSCSLVSFAAAPTTTTTTTTTTTSHGSGPIGGSTPLDVTSALVHQAALCAVTDLNARSNSVYQSELISVLSGTQQVVSGALYVMTFVAGESTQCMNDGSTPSLADCPVAPDNGQIYTATIQMQPWKATPCTVISHAAPLSHTGVVAASDSSSPFSSSSSSRSNAVVGGVIGGVVGAVLLAAVVAMVAIRRRRVAVQSTIIAQPLLSTDVDVEDSAQ